MSENAIESVKATPEPADAKPKRKPGKKAKPAKNAQRAKKAASKPKADRSNKKAEVIAMMKRAKGVARSSCPCMKPTGYRQADMNRLPSVKCTERVRTRMAASPDLRSKSV